VDDLCRVERKLAVAGFDKRRRDANTHPTTEEYMLNRSLAAPIIAILAALLLAAPALAQGAKKFAVIPFSYNGPQKYAYFPKAFPFDPF
ncbi:hypothetical protein, partial [Desulfolutivibrio sp.]|uniref:hypothetical protein n=1 Tax=Desulfolutivibrio sp. TaxID=2773296 RepID=UPI002F96C45D